MHSACQIFRANCGSINAVELQGFAVLQTSFDLLAARQILRAMAQVARSSEIALPGCSQVEAPTCGTDAHYVESLVARSAPERSWHSSTRYDPTTQSGYFSSTNAGSGPV
jgi:hypothetical protein